MHGIPRSYFANNLRVVKVIYDDLTSCQAALAINLAPDCLPPRVMPLKQARDYISDVEWLLYHDPIDWQLVSHDCMVYMIFVANEVVCIYRS